ncbi:hypothetical protein Tco_1436715, partial [Tanacetum coccineum]
VSVILVGGDGVVASGGGEWWWWMAVTCGGGVVAAVAVVVATSGGSGEGWWRWHVGFLGDPIEIRVDVVHPAPVVAVSFPAATEELTALRFRVDITEVENASLSATIRTMEAIEMVTRNHERLARIKIECQLASVQESHRQDREDFRKLKEFVTSQFGQRS